jgi:F0F1-type ATP synthase assembly protein I
LADRPPAQAPPKGSTEWARWSGVGFEFAAAVLAFFWLGSRLDATWGTSPWMRVAGAFLGVVVGTYLLIRQALRASRAGEPPRARRDQDSA